MTYSEYFGTSAIVSGQNHVHVSNPLLAGVTYYVLITGTNTTAPDLVVTVSATEFVVTQPSETGAGTFYYYCKIIP